MVSFSNKSWGIFYDAFVPGLLYILIVLGLILQSSVSHSHFPLFKLLSKLFCVCLLTSHPLYICSSPPPRRPRRGPVLNDVLEHPLLGSSQNVFSMKYCNVGCTEKEGQSWGYSMATGRGFDPDCHWFNKGNEDMFLNNFCASMLLIKSSSGQLCVKSNSSWSVGQKTNV